MTNDALTAINAFLYGRLSGRAGITARVADRIREQPRLVGGVLPYVSWRHVFPTQVNGTGGALVLVRSELIAYAVVAGTYGDADVLISELAAALDHAEGSSEGWRVGLVRERPHRIPHVTDGGQVLIEAGGVYMASAYRE